MSAREMREFFEAIDRYIPAGFGVDSIFDKAGNEYVPEGIEINKQNKVVLMKVCKSQETIKVDVNWLKENTK